MWSVAFSNADCYIWKLEDGVEDEATVYSTGEIHFSDGDYFGTESTSTVIQKMINEWAEIHWKAQTYDQLRDMILGYEAYHKYEGIE